MKARLLSVFLPALLLAPPFFAQEHRHDSMESFGSVNFPVSCDPAVQSTFTRGLALLYSFEYEQAQQAFENVAQRDPACAMAYWGQGMSLYHQLWDRPSKATLERGGQLLSKARELKSTPREHDYIQALSVFYTHIDQLDHAQRAEEYSNAMKGVTERNPDDREARIFYALSLLASGPDNDPNLTNAKAAVALLSKLFDEEPTHPGIAHYIIHSCDNPQMASLALPAARKYATIAPASPHAVHMPSHIFARLGLWQDDIQSNLAAIQIADKMSEMHLHALHHKVHSMDFLEYAYLQISDDAKAHELVRELSTMRVSPGDADFVQDYLQSRQSMFPVVYAIERRQWKEVLSLQPRDDAEPYTKSPSYWGRAVAAGHLHDAAAAQDALKHYDELVETTRKGPKPHIADGMKQPRKVMAAWTAYAAGKQEEALRALAEVADEQDKVGKGETEIPAREMLADMLLDSGRAQDALAQYELSLETDPNRFNGLFGAAVAAGKIQQREKATTYYLQLLKNCSGSHSERPELQQARTLVASDDSHAARPESR
jgi:tetratricopeptide (TPR) repeat protein